MKLSIISGRIHIANNWTDTKSAGICTGNGTYSEPYVIENLIIDGGGSGICILIENSDVFFKIENCTLYNSGVKSPQYSAMGIKLFHVNNSQLIDNNCPSNYYGIYLLHSNYNNVSGNTLGYSIVGLQLYYCNKNNISGNIANNSYTGINIDDSTLNNITGNEANNNNVGIYIDRSNNNTVLGNVASNNGVLGIILANSDNNTVSENTANNNAQAGLYLTYSDNNKILGNQLLGNRKCILEENCEGNTFKNNKCSKDIIAGYNPFILLVILSVFFIILRKKVK